MTGALDITRSRGDRPIYVQLAEHIAQEIHSGELLPGDRVASEPELVRLHGVSRATAIRALGHLEQRGLVRREQGRGTFVEAPRLVQRSAQLGSFSDEVRRHGHAPSQRLLRVGPPAEGGDDPAAAALRLRFWPEADVIELVRLRLVDGKPVGLHTTLLEDHVAERAGVVAEAFADEQASLYALLDAAGVVIADADEHLQAVAARAAEAKLLGIAPGSPLMRVVRVSYDAQGSPVEVVDARYHGDRFEYGVGLVRGHRDAGAGGKFQGKGHHDGQASEDPRRADRGRGYGGRVRQVGRRGVE